MTSCYYPDGSVASNYVVCNATQAAPGGGGSPCCDGGDGKLPICDAAGYCYGATFYPYRGACTDRSWQSSNCAGECVNGALYPLFFSLHNIKSFESPPRPALPSLPVQPRNARKRVKRWEGLFFCLGQFHSYLPTHPNTINSPQSAKTASTTSSPAAPAASSTSNSAAIPATVAIPAATPVSTMSSKVPIRLSLPLLRTRRILVSVATYPVLAPLLYHRHLPPPRRVRNWRASARALVFLWVFCCWPVLPFWHIGSVSGGEMCTLWARGFR